jgi:nicotinate phosphoribosyltransferase
VIINIARRAHDHNWELDPITRSLLDTDFYKLLMLQFIWKNFPRTQTSFTLLNRTRGAAGRSDRRGRAARATGGDAAAEVSQVGADLAGRQHVLWTRGIFEPAFLEWLEQDFRLSDFELSVEDGQLSLRFHGLWTETTLWEIYALSAIDELKTRASLKLLSEFELDILYARAKTRLWEKMERLRGVPRLSVSDFGTRRRHSFLWQEYVVKAMSDVLGSSFAGSSNTYLAYKHDLEAIGTNAHELPMALAALANDEEELRTAQYRILELWQQSYQGELLILLPDTFGTTQFLEDAPEWVAELDRAAHRQQGSLCGGRRIHCMAGENWGAIRGRSG